MSLILSKENPSIAIHAINADKSIAIQFQVLRPSNMYMWVPLGSTSWIVLEMFKLLFFRRSYQYWIRLCGFYRTQLCLCSIRSMALHPIIYLNNEREKNSLVPFSIVNIAFIIETVNQIRRRRKQWNNSIQLYKHTLQRIERRRRKKTVWFLCIVRTRI